VPSHRGADEGCLQFSDLGEKIELNGFRLVLLRRKYAIKKNLMWPNEVFGVLIWAPEVRKRYSQFLFTANGKNYYGYHLSHGTTKWRFAEPRPQCVVSREESLFFYFLGFVIYKTKSTRVLFC
jgi:hypothetical protein